MLLAIDIGNTNIVTGIFDGRKLLKVARIKTFPAGCTKFFSAFKKYFIEGVIISSVVPKAEGPVIKIIKRLFGVNPYLLTDDSFKDMLKIRPKKKKEIGIDRLVNAYAAKKIFGKPVIIIDFGTATTFCAVDKKGTYLGGAISPGVAISRDALHEKTAKLPLVDLKVPLRAIGDDTVRAMQSGILFGYVGIVEGLTKRFKVVLGRNSKVVATGGLAGIISSETDIIDITEPDLTLLGLEMIWEETWKKKNKI